MILCFAKYDCKIIVTLWEFSRLNSITNCKEGVVGGTYVPLPYILNPMIIYEQ